MLIRQSKNTFIRTTENYGYVSNQLTRHDRVYDENGAMWLRELSREPQDIDDIVKRLMEVYEDADFDTLKADFVVLLLTSLWSWQKPRQNLMQKTKRSLTKWITPRRLPPTSRKTLKKR